MSLDIQVREGCVEDDGELFRAPAGADHPVLQERLSGWGLERKGNVNRGRSAAAGLLAFITGALGCQVSVHRSWMGHRGSWEFNFQDQWAGKEGSSQV